VLPDAIELRRRSRTARDADRWIEQARLEAASIESFLRLADDLCALGAPEDLVVRACRAAEEERRHAELCLERSGAAVRLRGRSTKRRRANVTRLAHEAMQDGVLGEGRAACELLAKSFRARDPYVASVLRGMAIEEASHAQLACDVLEFCAMLGA